eukprot:11352408-Heterocapsa_arctica.AAC.1
MACRRETAGPMGGSLGEPTLREPPSRLRPPSGRWQCRRQGGPPLGSMPRASQCRRQGGPPLGSMPRASTLARSHPGLWRPHPRPWP